MVISYVLCIVTNKLSSIDLNPGSPLKTKRNWMKFVPQKVKKHRLSDLHKIETKDSNQGIGNRANSVIAHVNKTDENMLVCK